jgi:hypothetical protein
MVGGDREVAGVVEDQPDLEAGEGHALLDADAARLAHPFRP